MFGGGYPCIMAHCVHSNEDEQALMKKNGVFIAHSPESNMNLASGVAPVNKFLDDGLRVGLATDVAGGSHESMLRAMTHAIQASKLRWRLYDQGVKPLPFERAFYLATMAAARSSETSAAFWTGTNLTPSCSTTRRSTTRRSFPSAPGWNARPIWPTTGTWTAKFVAGQKILG